MRFPPMTTAAQLDARLCEQVLEVATLRLVLDMQFWRGSHMRPGFSIPPNRRSSPGLLMQAGDLIKHSKSR